MSPKHKIPIVLSLLIPGLLLAAALERQLEINDAARSWVVNKGHPLYYTSSKSHYIVDNQDVRRMPLYEADANILLSPKADYRLLARLQKLDEVKDGQRYADYFILNSQNDLSYKVSIGTSIDLKPLVPAISDRGVLALADPVKAKIYLYGEGKLISEGQLYEDEGQRSLERNIYLQWVGEQCYLLLERPGTDGQPGEHVLFIRLDADGRNQTTTILPISYLQKHIFNKGHFFISGYNYDAEEKEMNPLIFEVSNTGDVLWSNENFGHELALSNNGEYLTALTSHTSIQLFNLKELRVSEIKYEHDNKISLGMAVNDRGQVAVIRVAVDYFVKRNTYFSDIYLPQSGQEVTVQIDPRFPALFQLYSDGKRFFIGTNYEWLEIR